MGGRRPPESGTRCRNSVERRPSETLLPQRSDSRSDQRSDRRSRNSAWHTESRHPRPRRTTFTSRPKRRKRFRGGSTLRNHAQSAPRPKPLAKKSKSTLCGKCASPSAVRSEVDRKSRGLCPLLDPSRTDNSLLPHGRWSARHSHSCGHLLRQKHRRSERSSPRQKQIALRDRLRSERIRDRRRR